MTETTATDLVIRDTGEVVNWEDPNSLARALDWLREIEQEIRRNKATVSQALAAQAAIQGTKTLTLDDGRKAVVSGGTKTTWDAMALFNGLFNLGMPADRVTEIVEIEYKVNANEAKRAAGANPDYAELVESCKHEEPASFSVSLRNR